MLISVASGKGGTGKTTVAVNMALSLEGCVQLLDCDVEEPNAYIFLEPEISEVRPIRVPIPKIDEGLCDYCGKCAKFCEFHAIAVAGKGAIFFPEICHGCGGCSLVCPKKAIVEHAKIVGEVRVGKAGHVELVYGTLEVGEPMPGPVIREVKREIDRKKEAIIDAPPGTSCPVVESVYGSDYCLLVTEPTPFGLHDLKLMVQTLKELGIRHGAIVNRAGIGDRKVYEYCKNERIPILLEIPFDRRIAELYSKGVPFVREMRDWKENFRSLFSNVEEEVEK
ncbi:MAG: ATP-binding protein [Candidatus Brockarchaeota archaeon]|nr:ATP-binding protein [Candidatus Brockarchaeota archaeon]